VFLDGLKYDILLLKKYSRTRHELRIENRYSKQTTLSTMGKATYKDLMKSTELVSISEDPGKHVRTRLTQEQGGVEWRLMVGK
jgi:hypothetical protein